jgi:hypothetical protein
MVRSIIRTDPRKLSYHVRRFCKIFCFAQKENGFKVHGARLHKSQSVVFYTRHLFVRISHKRDKIEDPG